MTDRTYVEDGLGARLQAHDLDFALDTRVTDGTAVMVVSGELDIATAPLLCSALAAQRVGPADRVEVDLSGVTFLDTYAAGAMETARRALEDCGISVTLLDLGPRVALVLRLTGYERPGDGILGLAG